MAFTGMDIAQVRSVASQCDHAAEQLRSLTQDLMHRAEGVEWAGPDRDRFVNGWRSEHHARLIAAAAALEEASRIARNFAAQQEAASQDHGGHGHADRPGGGGGGGGW